MKAFQLTRDINGYNGFGVAFSDTKYSADLAQSTDTTLTIGGAAPNGMIANNINKYIALFNFEPGAQVWVANNATASAPAGATFALTNSELNPAGREVQDGDVLHFYTDDATGSTVSVCLYALL